MSDDLFQGKSVAFKGLVEYTRQNLLFDPALLSKPSFALTVVLFPISSLS